MEVLDDVQGEKDHVLVKKIGRKIRSFDPRTQGNTRQRYYRNVSIILHNSMCLRYEQQQHLHKKICALNLGESLYISYLFMELLLNVWLYWREHFTLGVRASTQFLSGESLRWNRTCSR